jgi:beta-xylosidase
MRDYHVLSMDNIGGKVTDHGVALDIADVPWAKRQMWAPDAAYKNGTYYLYFPVKDKSDIFRMGVATSKSPVGPFKAQSSPIAGSFSIDPAVFEDNDGSHYMYLVVSGAASCKGGKQEHTIRQLHRSRLVVKH